VGKRKSVEIIDCVLMHKNIPVVDIIINSTNGYIEKIGIIHNLEHIPIGTTESSTQNAGKPNRALLNDWWIGRSIPASRDKIQSALCVLQMQMPATLIAKCYGLSLSDQYWICPKDFELEGFGLKDFDINNPISKHSVSAGLKWEYVNFFDNDFSKDIGEILFGHEPEDISYIDMFSPDNTSDGWLQKKWVIQNGKRFLMKGGSGVFEQEPFNEVIASAILRRLGIRHVPYTLSFLEKKSYCLCENFVTTETEFIPAWRVIQTQKRDNRESPLTHLLRCCDKLEIPDVQLAIDKMLVLDYIIANEDRHYNNFGFLRNAETLEWLGFAPIFDSGTSLWYNTQHVGKQMESKPFKKSHNEQLKLVSNLEWFDSGTLEGIKDECEEILEQSDLVSPERATDIALAVSKRVLSISGKLFFRHS